MAAETEAPPVSLFYSYAHEDESLRNELCGHLKILERRGLLSQWHDRQIQAGEDWHSRISEELQTADLVLLLVSTAFINSDYIFGNELTVAMQRHRAGFATVVVAARERGESAIGLRLADAAADPSAGYGVRLNPSKSAPYVPVAGDRVVVLAED